MAQRQQYIPNDPYEEPYPRPSHHREKVVVAEETYTSRTVWLYGCCVFWFVLIVSLFIVMIVYYNNTNNFHYHMDQIISEMNEENSFQTDLKNMVSFSSMAVTALSQRFLKHNHLSLCYADLLRSESDTKSPLVPVIDQLSEDKNPYYYVLDMKLTMEFDVDTKPYLALGQSLSPSQRYMTIAYLVTSTYTRFSTIKLIESGLDNKNKALVRTKEIILCSNNPSLGAKACSGLNDDKYGSTGLFVKNTKLVVMSKLGSWPVSNNTRPGAPLPANGRDGKNTPPPKQYEGDYVEQYDIVHTDNKINEYKIEEDFTKDVRLYNVVFYQLTSPVTSESARYTQSDYKETLVLALKPNKCK